MSKAFQSMRNRHKLLRRTMGAVEDIDRFLDQIQSQICRYSQVFRIEKRNLFNESIEKKMKGNRKKISSSS